MVAEADDCKCSIRQRLQWCSAQGIVFEGRKERKGQLSPQKAAFAREASDAGIAAEAGTDLTRAVSLIRPA